MNLCVDASVVVKWLVYEEGSEKARALKQKWHKQGVQLVAPSLLDYEVGNAIRRKLLNKLISEDNLFQIFDFYKRSGILLFHLTDLVPQAVSAVAAINQPTIYDVAYLLVAKQQKADLITADEKFHQACQPLYPFVHYYRDLV